MNELEIKRKDRLAAIAINYIFLPLSFGFLPIVNLIMYSLNGLTVGAYFMGFATKKEDGTPPGFDGALLYWIVSIFVRFGYILSIGILFVYEMSTLEKRNGNLVESILKQKKVQNFE